MQKQSCATVVTDWSFTKCLALNAKHLGFRATGKLVKNDRVAAVRLGQVWNTTELQGIDSCDETGGFVISSTKSVYKLQGPANPTLNGESPAFRRMMAPFTKKKWPSNAQALFNRLSTFFLSNRCKPPPHSNTTLIPNPFSPDVPVMPPVKPPVQPLLQPSPAPIPSAQKVVTRSRVAAKPAAIVRRNGHLVCTHGRRKSMCSLCGGGSICPHKKQRYWCEKCSGKAGKTARCQHGKQKSRCAECGGRGICAHGRLKWRCTECKHQ